MQLFSLGRRRACDNNITTIDSTNSPVTLSKCLMFLVISFSLLAKTIREILSMNYFIDK